MLLSQLFSKCLSVSYTKAGVSANYALKRDGTTLYIFFEDSDGKTDWKNNVDFPAKAYRRMGKTVWFAHRGFLRVWQEILPLIAADVADRHFQKIIVAGYSHGGALALLCHEYVWFHRPDLRQTAKGVGFGAPRVLWGVKTPSVKKRFENFTVVRNLQDVVTFLPPAILGYFHVGNLIKIGQKGKYSPTEAHYAKNILTELLVYEQTLRSQNSTPPNV